MKQQSFHIIGADILVRGKGRGDKEVKKSRNKVI